MFFVAEISSFDRNSLNFRIVDLECLYIYRTIKKKKKKKKKNHFLIKPYLSAHDSAAILQTRLHFTFL